MADTVCTSSLAMLQCTSQRRCVGWAKAHSAVPTISFDEPQGVGTLALCPPYEIELVARSSCRRHAFAASRHILPELWFVASPSEMKEGAGKTGSPQAPEVHCANLRGEKLHSGIQV